MEGAGLYKVSSGPLEGCSAIHRTTGAADSIDENKVFLRLVEDRSYTSYCRSRSWLRAAVSNTTKSPLQL